MILFTSKKLVSFRIQIWNGRDYCNIVNIIKIYFNLKIFFHVHLISFEACDFSTFCNSQNTVQGVYYSNTETHSRLNVSAVGIHSTDVPLSVKGRLSSLCAANGGEIGENDC